MLDLVPRQKILSVESTIATLEITREGSGLVVLLVPSKMLGSSIGLPAVAVVHWLPFSGFANPASFCLQV